MMQAAGGSGREWSMYYQSLCGWWCSKGDVNLRWLSIQEDTQSFQSFQSFQWWQCWQWNRYRLSCWFISKKARCKASIYPTESVHVWRGREREQLTSVIMVQYIAYNSNSARINISGSKMSKGELMCTCIPYRMVRWKVVEANLHEPVWQYTLCMCTNCRLILQEVKTSVALEQWTSGRGRLATSTRACLLWAGL